MKKTILLFVTDFAISFVVFLLFYPKLIGQELDLSLFAEITVICLAVATVSVVYARKFFFKKGE